MLPYLPPIIYRNVLVYIKHVHIVEPLYDFYLFPDDFKYSERNDRMKSVKRIMCCNSGARTTLDDILLLIFAVRSCEYEMRGYFGWYLQATKYKGNFFYLKPRTR